MPASKLRIDMKAPLTLTERYEASETPYFTLQQIEWFQRPSWILIDPWGHRVAGLYLNKREAVWALNITNRMYALTPPKRACWCGLTIGPDVDRCDLHDDGKGFPVRPQFRPSVKQQKDAPPGQTKREAAKARRMEQMTWRD